MLPVPRAARYSGSDRPAWRMNQTGTGLKRSPLQARKKAESATTLPAMTQSQERAPDDGTRRSRGISGRPAQGAFRPASCTGQVVLPATYDQEFDRSGGRPRRDSSGRTPRAPGGAGPPVRGRTNGWSNCEGIREGSSALGSWRKGQARRSTSRNAT